MSTQPHFNSAEDLIRQKWLRSLITFALVAAVVSFIKNFSLNINTAPSSGIVSSLAWAIVHTIRGSINFYILYYCTYKHFGTKYLIFFLILLCLIFTVCLFIFWSSTAIVVTNLMKIKILAWIGLFILLLLARFVFLSFRIIAVNRAIQYRIIHGSEAYAMASASLQNAQSLKELGKKFLEVKEGFSWRLVAALNKIYVKRQKELKDGQEKFPFFPSGPNC